MEIFSPKEAMLFSFVLLRSRDDFFYRNDDDLNENDEEFPEDIEEYVDLDEMDEDDYQRMPLRKKDNRKNKSDESQSGKPEKPKKFPEKRNRKVPRTDDKNFGKKKFSEISVNMPLLIN